jgi:hypothetical protein
MELVTECTPTVAGPATDPAAATQQRPKRTPRQRRPNSMLAGKEWVHG